MKNDIVTTTNGTNLTNNSSCGSSNNNTNSSSSNNNNSSNKEDTFYDCEAPVFSSLEHNKFELPIVFIVTSKWTNYLNSKSVQTFMAYKNEFYEKHGSKSHKLITLNYNHTFDESLNILKDNSISASPVIGNNLSVSEFKGFIDILDFFVLISYIIQRQKFSNYTPNQLEQFSITDIFNQPLKNAINFSSLFDSRPIYDNMSLLQALEVLLMPGSPFRGHRLGVFNSKTKQLIGVLSQTDLLYLAKDNIQQMSLTQCNKTAKELKITKPVITVPSNILAKDAFLLLHANRISGIAVVDPQDGKLLHSLTPGDLKYLTKSTVDYISLPLSSYFKFVKRELKTNLKQVVIIDKSNTLLDIVNLMCDNRVIRVYICDQDTKPLAVVTISDVLSCLLNC